LVLEGSYNLGLQLPEGRRGATCWWGGKSQNRLL